MGAPHPGLAGPKRVLDGLSADAHGVEMMAPTPNDFLSGDRGDDTVTGGAGADIFHTFEGAGIDRVLDFSFAEGDRLMLEVPGARYQTPQVGADTVVAFSDGYSKLILVGVQMSSLVDGWIS